MLEVRNLSIKFSHYGKGLKKNDVMVVSSLDIEINPGEIVAVVGASGSGKSLLAHAILDILPSNATKFGTIEYNSAPLDSKTLKKLRGREIVIVPQSVNFLDPLMKVGKQLDLDKKQVYAVFQRYKLPLEVYGMYPHQLSGGMIRRILLATAVVSGAKLIIADEPTPGLSEDLALEALSHFRMLAREGCGIMLITHDINMALKVSDRIAVFYAGKTMEIANAADFCDDGSKLRHPYTKALWQALPQNGFKTITVHQEIGAIGCGFAPSCHKATNQCQNEIPMRQIRGAKVRCINAT